MTTAFYGITLQIPAGWEDITDALADGSPPTIAKASGVGAVQFSIAKCQSGEQPNADLNALKSLMIGFCQNNQIEIDQVSEGEFGRVKCASIFSENGSQVISAWLLTNGKDFALVTYVALGEENDEIAGELDQAREIISSISFDTQ